jgi:hypothetical protein
MVLGRRRLIADDEIGIKVAVHLKAYPRKYTTAEFENPQ